MDRRWVLGLKVALSIIFAIGLLAQVLAVFVAADLTESLPPHDYPAALYSSLIVVTIFNLQSIVINLWRLLRFLPAGAVFTRDALRPISEMIYAGAAASLLTGTLLVHASTVHGLGLHVILLVFAAAFVLAGTFTVLMVIVRRLLRAAMSLQTELSGVI